MRLLSIMHFWLPYVQEYILWVTINTSLASNGVAYLNDTGQTWSQSRQLYPQFKLVFILVIDSIFLSCDNGAELFDEDLGSQMYCSHGAIWAQKGNETKKRGEQTQLEWGKGESGFGYVQF